MSLIVEIERRIAAAEARAGTAETDLLTDDEQIDPEDVPAEYREDPETDESSPADPATVAEYCAANGCSAIAAQLIREKVTMAHVKDRVDAAGQIRALVADASAITETIGVATAEDFIKSGLSVDQVRFKLWDSICAAQSPEICSSISSDTGLDALDSRYARSMDAAIAKVNARVGELLPQGTQEREG